MNSPILATVLHGPHPSARDTVLSAFRAGRYYEFGGGLGDIIIAASHSDVFARLDEGGSLPIVVTLITHNSCAWELFAYHPKASCLLIVNIPFREAEDRTLRERYGLPPKPQVRPWLYEEGAIRFHGTEQDRMILSALPVRRVVLATTASNGPTDQRTMPPWLAESAVRTILERGLTPILVGRTYVINGSGVKHVDAPPPHVLGLLNLTDRLTVPGVFELVRTSSVTVSCDSAVACAAHVLMRPTFSVVHDARWKSCGGNREGHGTVLHERFYQSMYGAYRDELLGTFLRKHAP